MFKKLLNRIEKAAIKKVHNEFDTAQDRLLKEANIILNSIDEDELNIGLRLMKIGFMKNPIVKKIDHPIISNSKQKAELVQYYSQTYPFLKFLTEIELKRICKKYNLVFAPIDRYIKDVPLKNITEIEDAQKLKDFDIIREKKYVKVEKFCHGVPFKLKNILKSYIAYNPDVARQYSGNEYLLKLAKEDYGYNGDYSGEIFNYRSDIKIKSVNVDGLFICAPKNHFDLKGLSNEGGFGFLKVSIIKNDPIVFRYCRGGVQVITKWGLEASDPELINPKFN
jgi:hypothetical protein